MARLALAMLLVLTACHREPRPLATTAAAEAPLPFGAQPDLPRRRVAGQVLDARGPVAGATVRLSRLTPDDAMYRLERTTDADGRFDFGALPAGDFDIAAQAEGHASDRVLVDAREPAPLTAPDATTLWLPACDHVVTGTVRDAGGRPVPHAHVEQRGDTSWAIVAGDAEGRYRLCARPGFSWLVVRAAGKAATLAELDTAETHTVDVTLADEAVVTGVVHDAEGRPVAGAIVFAATQEDRVVAGAPRATTDARGAYRLAHLPAGPLQVVAQAAGHARTAGVRLEATAAGARADLVLPRAHVLRGQLVDDHGPVAGVLLYADSPAFFGHPSSAISQADGRFALPGLPAASVTLRLRVPLAGPATFAVPSAPISVRAVPTQLVRGRVTAAGRPVPRAWVVYVGDAHLGGSTFTEADGRYQLRLAAGTYRVSASSDDLPLQTKTTATVAGEPLVVDLGDGL